MSSSRTPGVLALSSASLAAAVSGPAAGGSASVATAAFLGLQSSSPRHSETVQRSVECRMSNCMLNVEYIAGSAPMLEDISVQQGSTHHLYFSK